MTTLRVIQGDVTEIEADVLLLKYARDFWGVDSTVAKLLLRAGVCDLDDLRPPLHQTCLWNTSGAIAPKKVLYVGTEGLSDFGYPQMREFARQAIEKLSQKAEPVNTLTTTIHGVNYGLDATESFEELSNGFREGINRTGMEIGEICFVDRDNRTVRLLNEALPRVRGQWQANAWESTAQPTSTMLPAGELVDAAVAPARQRTEKPHVFVAMPFAEEFDDVYEFGIYGPVRRSGYICERVDDSSFTGDILERIRRRIETAELVIAELTAARPNVYLEVGYAWGKEIPVIFLARDGEEVHFDVAMHRCIRYKTIGNLARELEKLLKGVQRPGI